MNPLFPLNEYIPDGEPHVFEDRVYLYGSHDAENGTRFCIRDYTVWSAPVTDLTKWTCHGTTYRKIQDPRSSEGKLVDFYAPDCVRGNDGRYYLYYFAAGPNTHPFGPMSVAVADKPEGPFEYLSDIHYADGSPVLDFLTNDPAVINDDGKIWLYYGWGLGRDFSCKACKPLFDLVLSKLCNRTKAQLRKSVPSVLSCAVVELNEDMCTVKSAPKAVLDSKTTARKGTPLFEHPFYEAPSIRKFGDTYYLIYSSNVNNELAYATSKSPDKGFEYRGVLISNSDLSCGNKKPLMPAGTIHGSVERIGEDYYVFYHRCTNDTDFSRQACAEKIEMRNDGTFVTAHPTTQGTEPPLSAKGSYPAAICCNLYNKCKTDKRGKRAIVTAENGEVFVARLGHGNVVAYKYMRFSGEKEIIVRVKGGGGKIAAFADQEKLGEIVTQASDKWQEYHSQIKSIDGIRELRFVFDCKEPTCFSRFEMR